MNNANNHENNVSFESKEFTHFAFATKVAEPRVNEVKKFVPFRGVVCKDKSPLSVIFADIEENAPFVAREARSQVLNAINVALGASAKDKVLPSETISKAKILDTMKALMVQQDQGLLENMGKSEEHIDSYITNYLKKQRNSGNIGISETKADSLKSALKHFCKNFCKK